MERAPDQKMLDKAVGRRQTFPVAVVVVAHGDISLMRPALEEVAVVVEHIVSEYGWLSFRQPTKVYTCVLEDSNQLLAVWKNLGWMIAIC